MEYKWNGRVSYTEISHDIFLNHLKKIKECKFNIISGKYEKFYELIQMNNTYRPLYADSVFIEDDQTFIYLTYKRGKNWINVKTDKYKSYKPDEIIDPVNVAAIWSYFKRYVKFDKKEFNIPIMTAHRLTYKNLKYVNTEQQNCIEYDLHAAYLHACDHLQAPLHFLRKDDFPKENEVGFTEIGIPIYGPSDTKCSWIYSCGIDEGLQKWCDKIKENLEIDKNKWKNYYTIPIGYLEKKDDMQNRPLANCIIYRSNKFIKQYFDENTLWSTTDSIVSRTTRNDIPLGDEVGQFKIKHEGTFRYTNTGYQWNNDAPSNKGISKGKYGKDFNILTDSIEYNHKEPLIIFNWKELKIEKNTQNT